MSIYVRVQGSGFRVYGVEFRDPNNKREWHAYPDRANRFAGQSLAVLLAVQLGVADLRPKGLGFRV